MDQYWMTTTESEGGNEITAFLTLLTRFGVIKQTDWFYVQQDFQQQIMIMVCL